MTTGMKTGRGPAGRMALGVAMVAAALAGPRVMGQFAAEVIRYQPGTGYATEFGTGLGYTLTDAILGEPSRATGGMFPGPVDPFSPPYLREQVLSLGVGGLVEVRLDSPATRDSGNPFGIDFSLYGGGGFIIVNGDYTGGGITDGSVFGVDASVTRVSVSADGVRYFALDGSLAPAVESGLPTDGVGDFRVPVNPSVKLTDFAGLGYAGIRNLYAGSAGGTGYSLAWARDENGAPVEIASASFLRIEVLSGRVEIDGVATVRPVPEPSTWALLAGGLGLLGLALVRRGGCR